MTDDKRIAALEAEIDRLKPTSPSDLDAAKWRDEMHQMRERRASAHLPFSRSDLAAMDAAAPAHVVRAIVGRDSHAPTGPSSAGASGQITRVSTSPGIIGSNTGWAREIPIGPPPGLRYVDAQLDAQDAVDRHEKIVEEAERQALLKEAEKSE